MYPFACHSRGPTKHHRPVLGRACPHLFPEEDARAKAADAAEAAAVAQELGLEVAGGFQKTQREMVQAELAAAKAKDRENLKKFRRMVKNEPMSVWRENRDMRREEKKLAARLMQGCLRRRRAKKELARRQAEERRLKGLLARGLGRRDKYYLPKLIFFALQVRV